MSKWIVRTLTKEEMMEWPYYCPRRYKCPSCGREWSYGETPYCPYCGVKLDEKD